jgi:hypothetical protein
MAHTPMRKADKFRGPIVFVLGLLLAASSGFASQDSLVTAVFSSVSNGYARTKMPDGSFKRETYAISNGGYASGLARDHSIDDVKFPAIAGLVAEHLARKNYFLAQDAKSADLLLVISWGTSTPFSDGINRMAQDNALAAMNNVKSAVANAKVDTNNRSVDGIQSPAAEAADAARSELEGQLFELQMFNDMRSKANEQNARLLGYMKEINSRNDPSRYAGAGTYYDDLISDIESERYYVIVAAYDFRVATQEKKKKLLWSTRVSIQTQGNRFNESLATMLANASRHFGQDSGHLIKQYLPNTRVDLGELKILGMVPQSSMPEKPASEK